MAASFHRLKFRAIALGDDGICRITLDPLRTTRLKPVNDVPGTHWLTLTSTLDRERSVGTPGNIVSGRRLGLRRPFEHGRDASGGNPPKPVKICILAEQSNRAGIGGLTGTTGIAVHLNSQIHHLT